MIDLLNKNIAVLGLGDENIALVDFLISQNIKFTICDKKSAEELGEVYNRYNDNPNVSITTGENYLDNLEKFDIVFRTPGLPYLNEKIQKAKSEGVKISSEIELFFARCPCPIIGVTGTKGKGTTATLISKILTNNIQQTTNNKKNINVVSRELLVSGGSNVYLAGNIGNAPIQFLDKLKPTDIVVLELSSFQLQGLEYSPHIAVVLDIKIDHLDYHKNKTEYIEAKKNIVRYQTNKDYAVINADYLTDIEFATETQAKVFWFSRRKTVNQGAWIKNDQIYLKIDDQDIPVIKTSEVILRGNHNLENIGAAITASYIAGVDVETISTAVKNFKGLEHRLEFIRKINNVFYYNDSFSTTPDTTIAAIQSFSEPIVLLIGGSEKGADYEGLSEVISSSSVKAVISIGKTATRIIDKITNKNINIIKEIKTMTQAIEIAQTLASSGDIVILSPASASFDNYKNYKDRGDQFKQKVLSL